MISDDPVWLVVMLGAIACVLSLGLVVSDVILPRVQRWRMRRMLHERSRYVDPALRPVRLTRVVPLQPWPPAPAPDESGYTTTRLQVQKKP